MKELLLRGRPQHGQFRSRGRVEVRPVSEEEKELVWFVQN